MTTSVTPHTMSSSTMTNAWATEGVIAESTSLAFHLLVWWCIARRLVT